MSKMKKIMFFDIDGVLTATPEYIPNTSPKLTKNSIQILKKVQRNGFETVFITARSVRELRLKNGFYNSLKKNKLLENSLVYGAMGLDEAGHSYEFKMKKGKVVFKNGSAVLVKKPIIKRETFANLEQYLLYKMLIGKEIKQQLKYAGFNIASARPEEMINDARIGFELVENKKNIREKATKKAQEICDEQYAIFQRTKKFGSPVQLIARDIITGISIEPIDLGKHLGVLRALNKLKIKPNEKIEGYAFGDSKHDSKMKIRKDIQFLLVKNNEDFVEKVENILKKK